MYNRSKKTKRSTQELKIIHHKAKTIRNSAIKTPSHLEGVHEERSPQLSKFKSIPTKAKRHTATSLLPNDALSSDNEAEIFINAYKTNKTNTTTVDIPHSHSEKTLNLISTDKIHKSTYKHDKTGKKRKTKTDKFDLELKINEKYSLTSRKNSTKKLTLNALLRKTDCILKKYQKKEE